MSKLSDSIKATRTGFLQPNDFIGKVLFVDEELTENRSNWSYEYDINAIFRRRVFIDISNSDALLHAIHDSKKSIIEAVFGEFRVDLREISHAIYDRKSEKALELVRNLEEKMFRC